MWCFIEEDAVHGHCRAVQACLLCRLPARIYRDIAEYLVDISGGITCANVAHRTHIGMRGQILNRTRVFDTWEGIVAWTTVRVDNNDKFKVGVCADTVQFCQSSPCAVLRSVVLTLDRRDPTLQDPDKCITVAVSWCQGCATSSCLTKILQLQLPRPPRSQVPPQQQL